MNNIYIIIVTYNGMQWLEKCLESCSAYSVVVIDNCSTDNTLSFIQTCFPKVKLLKQDRNKGFGQANNIGISYALNNGAEHVFLLNQDAYIVNNSLDNLVLFQKQNPEYGIVSPIHITGDKKLLDKKFSEFMLKEYTGQFYSDFVLGNSIKEVYNVPFVNAAAWLISKECLETVGGFDPLFFHYGEDDNYCQRVKFHEFKIGVLPSVYIIHDRFLRENHLVKLYSKKYYEIQENTFKIRFGNINNPNMINELNNKLKDLKLQFLKSILFLKITAYKVNYKKYLSLKKDSKNIIDSYNINKLKGSHYLDN